MGLETNFRIFAIDNHNFRSESEVKELVKAEIDHSFRSYSDEEKADIVLPQFIRDRGKPTDEDIKYNMLPEQIHDPFPTWIDVTTGQKAYELMDVNFLSDFRVLYEHWGIGTNEFTNQYVLSFDEIKRLRAVVDYILNGHYDKYIEDAIFYDNEFFHLFEDQYWFFAKRFRKPKTKTQPQIKIVIEDKRAYVEDQTEDYEDSYEYEEDVHESEMEDRYELERIKFIIDAFCNMNGKYDYKDESKRDVLYRLVYTISY